MRVRQEIGAREEKGNELLKIGGKWVMGLGMNENVGKYLEIWVMPSKHDMIHRSRNIVK